MDGLAAERAVFEGGGALHAADQVAARKEYHSDFIVHADLARPLLLQPTVLALQV